MNISGYRKRSTQAIDELPVSARTHAKGTGACAQRAAVGGSGHGLAAGTTLGAHTMKAVVVRLGRAPGFVGALSFVGDTGG